VEVEAHGNNQTGDRRNHQPEPVHRPAASMGVLYARAFAGLFLRDLHVLRREMVRSWCASL